MANYYDQGNTKGCIRWYDYIVAFLAADLFLSNIMLAVSPDFSIFLNMLGTAGAYFTWKLWNENYTDFRVKQESKK